MTFGEELELAKKRGYKTGYEIGYKIGYDIGYDIGYNIEYKEGIEIGKLQLSKEVAKRLLEMEMEITFVSEVTGLSLEEIHSLEVK